MQRTIERLRSEFLEMPGLRLTPDQVQRLCGVDARMCKVVLDALVEARFLCVRSDGSYARATEGVGRPQPAKAELRPSRRTAHPRR